MTSKTEELLLPEISETENTFLCKQPDEREIVKVVKQLGASKASESDGMTASFFHFWTFHTNLWLEIGGSTIPLSLYIDF